MVKRDQASYASFRLSGAQGKKYYNLAKRVPLKPRKGWKEEPSKPICETHEIIVAIGSENQDLLLQRKSLEFTRDLKSSSEKEHKENALALGADEGRDKLRKASGSSKYALIRRCPNGETRHESCRVTVR